MIDPSYTSEAVAWLIVWAALGLTGRRLLAGADQRRHARRQAEQQHGKAAR